MYINMVYNTCTMSVISCDGMFCRAPGCSVVFWDVLSCTGMYCRAPGFSSSLLQRIAGIAIVELAVVYQQCARILL